MRGKLKGIIGIVSLQVLKGPKREMLVAGIFTEVRPVWVGDLETRPKKSKKFMFGALHYPLFPGIFALAL